MPAAGPRASWVFNIWGSFDLLNAFYQASASGLSPGQFGAAFFLPTFIVPILLITHGLVFRILLTADRRPVFDHAPIERLGKTTG